jgi:mRNA interferase RelE/StbE
MTYRVEIPKRVQKDIDSLPTHTREAVLERLRALVTDPPPPGCKKLKDSDAWRLRVGDYGVVYEIHDRQLLVVIIRVAHRRDVYR